ncbi:hypothetical protein KAT95_02470 [Candidatus Parcubacteria bacterium]|nr:hypothetical protein [Candidatus Parcubacteria bacterium]
MTLFEISLIYLLLFFLCFVFTLRYKERLSKHDGDFPETLIKTFVLFIYIGGIFGVVFCLPFFMSQTQQITQSMDLSSFSASLADNFVNLLEPK